MSINNAKKFIRQVQTDNELRTKLNTAADNEAREQILHQEDLIFNYEEFDNAYSMLLACSQFEVQAQELQELKMWWDLLLHY